jgi:class 3 adenylate cyclase
VRGRPYYFCALACKQAFFELGLEEDVEARPRPIVVRQGKLLSTRPLPEGAVAILFTDIQGSTELMEQMGQETAHTMVRTELDRQQQVVQRHEGNTVKRLGDGMMAAFAAPRSALLCAVDVQSDEGRDAKVRVRIGLHAGEVIVDGDDYFGKTVIMAARIMARARGGEIAVSEGCLALLDPPAGWRYGSSRRVRLKGFSGWQRITVLERAEPQCQ